MNFLTKNSDEEKGNNLQIKNVFKKYDLYTKYFISDFNSSKYWQNRYLKGGNSGSGSYNHLAEYKADIINHFIINNNISSIIEFGCGDGNNLSLYKVQQYLGIDVSEKAIKLCKKIFTDDKTKSFLTTMEFESQVNKFNKADLSLSLDVIYHLIEDSIFHHYMNQLFENAEKYIIIYASNKNETLCSHVKHREFTSWIDDNIKGWFLVKFIKNKYPFELNKPKDTTFSDFYIYEKK